MNVTLIGAGSMAVAYAKALQSLDVPFRCCGRGAASAEAFEAATGVPAGTGPLAEQIAAAPVTGEHVIVAVDLLELAPVCRLLLPQAPAKILVEKPGALRPAEMTALAGTDPDGRIRVAYNRRFLSSALRARELVAVDGGVQSLQFEFTELSGRIGALGVHPPEVLAAWPYANSSHVFDLAFVLAGAATDLSDVTIAAALQRGALDWHRPGARFAATGTIGAETLFTCAADWQSGGGWGVELTTARRRLRLRPLERLTEQLRDSFDVREVELPAEAPGLKPGLRGMLADLLETGGAGLPTMAEQAARMTRLAEIIGH